MAEPFLVYTRNAISLLGAVMVTASAMLILFLFGLDLTGVEMGPYVGILVFLILPGVFLLGLALIPLGAWRARRQARRRDPSAPPPGFPVFDLNSARTRRGVLVFVALSAVNIAILAVASYKGLDVMDSVGFCGNTCHTVMQPEFTAYQRSPHARVKCTECHIGAGASWFVKSKLSGSWQLVSVAFNLYPRPIPTPVQNLRPARETCEACHWPQKFEGEKLKVETHFSDDEKAVASKNVLLLHIGGKGPKGAQGIHWHVDPSVKIRYLADAKRTSVRDVELTLAGGEQRVYKAAADQPAPEGPLTWRAMDCVDCHNRPTHIYSTPEIEIDAALGSGQVSAELPFIRREGLRLLKADYPSAQEARAQIGAGLAGFYAKEKPEVAQASREAIEKSGAALADIWQTHVFPEMKVGWGTYPSFLGHEQAPGCYRCHDGEHATAEGRTISQKCTLCHSILAQDEESPEILGSLHMK